MEICVASSLTCQGEGPKSLGDGYNSEKWRWGSLPDHAVSWLPKGPGALCWLADSQHLHVGFPLVHYKLEHLRFPHSPESGPS